MYNIVAQSFGLIGLFFNVFSFQHTKNKTFFKYQILSALMFFVNYLLIGATMGALTNIVTILRGKLFENGDCKPWKLIVIETLYTICFLISICTVKGSTIQLILTVLTLISPLIKSFFLWKGNAKHIRISELFCTTPIWIVYNIFNFTLGGIISELLTVISIIISFLRCEFKGNSEQV